MTSVTARRTAAAADVSVTRLDLNPVFPLVTVNGHTVQPRNATLADINAISELIASEVQVGKLIPRTPEQLAQWINEGRSFVAVDLETNEVVGHVGLYLWFPPSATTGIPVVGCVEEVSVVVNPAYRNSGIYRDMHDAIATALFQTSPDAEIVDIKSVNSNGYALLHGSGYVEVPLSHVEANGLVILHPEMGPWRAFVLTKEVHKANLRERNAMRHDIRGPEPEIQ